MSRPGNRAELLARIDTDFADLLAEVEKVTPARRSIPGACEQWSVKDLLAHLDEWHELFLTWNEAGSAGRATEMPAPGYTWQQTPALNEVLWARRRDDPLDDVLTRLSRSHDRLRAAVEAYDDDSLFAKRRYRWTGTTSVGSYAVSASTSHYDWARKLIRRFARAAEK